uniref:Uncharacterized protein n=1 Tax=Nelumbo nucifera TaxID=4432 RepID=A0A822YK90_NELNU|nr:TPA_asm: hypothetical protein HUJ06_005244 [Nelumbo nucifera]
MNILSIWYFVARGHFKKKKKNLLQRMAMCSEKSIKLDLSKQTVIISLLLRSMCIKLFVAHWFHEVHI